ncbi:hypothetical protein JW805_09220 [Roseomonas aeriglobus]|nr:hypothetical protein [Roseomonas aeriglobus]
MTIPTSTRPTLIAFAATLAVAAIGAAGMMVWRRRDATRDDSIEPRHMPGSAANIHVAGGVPLERR